MKIQFTITTDSFAEARDIIERLGEFGPVNTGAETFGDTIPVCPLCRGMLKVRVESGWEACPQCQKTPDQPTTSRKEAQTVEAGDYGMPDLAKAAAAVRSHESLDGYDLLGGRKIIDIPPGEYAPLIQRAKELVAQATAESGSE